jgi:hypothetical protein
MQGPEFNTQYYQKERRKGGRGRGREGGREKEGREEWRKGRREGGRERGKKEGTKERTNEGRTHWSLLRLSKMSTLAFRLNNNFTEFSISQ